MIYFDFLKSISKYLISVRMLKDHVSFDMMFPDSWIMSKKILEGINGVEILNGPEISNMKTLSFICPNKEDNLNKLEDTIEKLVKFNKEKEEKDKLFRQKIQELKEIFEKNNIDELRYLDFNTNSLSTQYKFNDDEQIGQGNKERGKVIRTSEEENDKGTGNAEK